MLRVYQPYPYHLGAGRLPKAYNTTRRTSIPAIASERASSRLIGTLKRLGLRMDPAFAGMRRMRGNTLPSQSFAQTAGKPRRDIARMPLLHPPPRPEVDDPRASRIGGVVAAGRMQRARGMNGDAADGQRAMHALAVIHAERLERMRLRVVAALLVRVEPAEMAAGHEPHATILHRRVLQRHPEVEALKRNRGRISLVLMPRRLADVERPLIDGMIVNVIHRAAGNLLRHCQAIPVDEGILQLRGGK